MTSLPEVPGAPAVYLYKEQTAEDSLHMWSYYVRLKILTEGGKQYANVELPYVAGAQGWGVDSVGGRTIHPDGTITMFTGKPYDKVIMKQGGYGGYQYKMKVFTLPAVEVGSIIEYRYKLHYDDAYFSSPDWYIQSDLYTKSAHYMWKPTDRNMTDEADGGKMVSTIAWMPILPKGAEIKQSHQSGLKLELDVRDVMPTPKEEMAPPLETLSYRVLFYFTPYRTAEEYWKNRGNSWSKAHDKFIGPGKLVRSTVEGLVAAGDTEDQKLRKIYAAVMALENTDFTREHSNSEDKAQGLKQINTTDDILARKRGSGDQLTDLFVAMVRAAGMKGYVMGVANRSERIFLLNYLSLRQMDDDIAIVSVGGKDEYFDPGQRYCSFGKLSWKHQMTGGVRQKEGGTEISGTPAEPFKEAHVQRLADLQLDDTGLATGKVTVISTGDPALHWRQEALRGDDTSLNADLRDQMERMLPGGMEVRVTNVENLSDPEKPLKVVYEVKGGIGTPTGKRLMVPANLFAANSKSKFNTEKRELPLDFHYASFVQDAVRLKLPPSLVVESSPAAGQSVLNGAAGFTVSSTKTPTTVTSFRNVTEGKVVIAAADYGAVRTYYQKLEERDADVVILSRPAPGAVPAGAAKGGN